MASVIRAVVPGSPADRAGIRPGDKLLSVGGNAIEDVLDYKYYTYDARLLCMLESPDGKTRKVKIKKGDGEDLGLEFETYLMDKARACANKCVFCFVDQLPRGMRRSLYFKDDDARLSFLMGNYITLTNLSPREIQRIIDLKVSPINVSVHATDPELRCRLLGSRRGGEGIGIMRRFAQAGIQMNCQIVCCPGLNDGAELQRTMEDLRAMYPGVNSVSIVPVGLTKHRENLYPLEPFDKARAYAAVKQVEAYGETCLKELGTRLFFPSDELYLKAELPIPEDGFFEEYTQLENGVGMLRLLITEFEAALKYADIGKEEPFSVATGVSAAPFIRALIEKAKEKFAGLDGRVYAIENDFFGHTIDVAGLVTGGDLIRQLKGKELGGRLLIPQNMLRHGEGVFLDDVTVEDVERELQVHVVPVQQDGGQLLDAVLGIEETEVETWQNH